MCLRPAASCRLCLSDNINERCLDLCEDGKTADQYQELLCLQWSLTKAVPHHVCVTCHSIVSAFQSLKQTAHNNESIIREKYFPKEEWDASDVDDKKDNDDNNHDVAL